MRKSKILISILIGIFLVGCTENEVVKEEPVVDPPQEIGKPFDFYVLDENSTGYDAILDTFCWEEEEVDKTCSLEPTPPNELLKRETHISLTRESKVSFSFPASDSDRIYLTNPEKIELIQIGKDGESTFEVIDKQFTAPKEKGVYYYSAILTWDGDLKGEAIYAFSLSVR